MRGGKRVISIFGPPVPHTPVGVTSAQM